MSEERSSGRRPAVSPEAPQPVVVSLTRAYQVHLSGAAAETWSRRLTLVLMDIATGVRQKNGFIGHIKAFLTFETGGALGLSLVRDSVDLKEFEYQGQARPAAFKLALTAIVYGCSRDDLTQLAEAGLSRHLPESQVRPSIPPKGDQ